MNLKELQDQATIDTAITDDNLSEYTLSVPAITTKWLRYLSEERIMFEALEIDMAVKRKARGHYYRFDSDFKFKDKAHYDELIRGDATLNKIKAKLVLSAEAINFIEGVIKTLNNASFNIGNYIKWQMFKTGGY
jgi:hypothetical protein